MLRDFCHYIRCPKNNDELFKGSSYDMINSKKYWNCTCRQLYGDNKIYYGKCMYLTSNGKIRKFPLSRLFSQVFQQEFQRTPIIIIAALLKCKKKYDKRLL